MINLLDYANSLGYVLEDENLEISSSSPFSSVRLIQLLNELENAQTRVRELLSLNSSSQYCADHFDFLHLPTLVDNIKVLEELSHNLNGYIEQKSTIAAHLQQPFSGDYVVVDAVHQKKLHYIVTGLSRDISSLSNNLNNLEWVHSFSVEKQTNLKNLLDQLASLVARYQRYREALVVFETTVHNFASSDQVQS